jgi:ABC-2 type transport system permease protein
MTDAIRAVLTIARRDITATVLSRGFLIWLAMPVVGLIFGLVVSLATGPEQRTPPRIAVIDDGSGYASWLTQTAMREATRATYAQLRHRFTLFRKDTPLPAPLSRPAPLLSDGELDALGSDDTLAKLEARHDLGLGALKGQVKEAVPARLSVVAASGAPDHQAAAIVRGRRYDAVVYLDNGAPAIAARRTTEGIDEIRHIVGLAWSRQALAAAGLDRVVDDVRRTQPDVALAMVAGSDKEKRRKGGGPLATGTATVLFALISLLAGALLSNMVEEKANKIIEVLVASVPVPAIYAGKLVAMLVVSLVGIAVWGVVFGGGAALAIAQLPAGLLAAPARGWPELVLIATGYFVCAYLIYGAVYLGIGSMCASIREVQTLSMPVTILQMVVLVMTLSALDRPGSVMWSVASWFPLSAPYMMAGRAAGDTALGIHVFAMLWQLGFAAIVIAFAARLFRFGVLRSGPPPRLRDLLGTSRTRA